MNTKEIGEIRRRVRRDRSNMTAIYGCYVNDNKEIISRFQQSTGIMPENEADKYFGLLRRSLSGTIGKNLIDITFKTSQVADSPEHKLLMTLRASRLKDEEALEEFYQKIVQSVNLDSAYLILIGCDAYDVPFKSKDDSHQADASEETYTYLLCAICPVKQTKANLHYIPESKEFHDGGMMNVVAAPELGFLFPAFDNRATNIYNALYYTHSPKENHEGFVEFVFNAPIPRPAAEQKKSFQRIELHKESKIPEPLMIGKAEVAEVLTSCGVSEDRVAKFSIQYDEAFGYEAALHPKNIIDNKRFEVRTPDVSIKVAPDRTDLIETRVIGGVKYILISAEEDVEVNGVSIHIHSRQEEPASV